MNFQNYSSLEDFWRWILKILKIQPSTPKVQRKLKWRINITVNHHIALIFYDFCLMIFKIFKSQRKTIEGLWYLKIFSKDTTIHSYSSEETELKKKKKNKHHCKWSHILNLLWFLKFLQFSFLWTVGLEGCIHRKSFK